ncbi:two-component system sensor histidine kinase RstB [Vibrio crassostreae]|uniref:ATP-binding protein n=1 Tax=Vibrio crassostreae TaxID=246167 RepID=UPI000F4629B0|nr:ATP-binding protein [Vibrio crassostreae]NOH73771.1 HAMP domain-containing protein [Vibrio crassostreae]ROR11057.1 two-component system sensor histidine kinase RstB [Vibrio crassostreae]TCN77846.1 two-component system sensor histidine kinase RstB [Vibrio crassostreae]TWD40858.1 two-component system sensor histidine kinase RstB [Vibrio crassostreae]TWD71615.1 two-component system sensor histidine kinase RstB [Vibrio crassostreae]
MRRIYFEYLAGLTVIFLVSIYSYAFIVYKLSTDYEYILRDHEAEAYQELIDVVFREKGLLETQNLLKSYADKTRQNLRIIPFDNAPELVRKAFQQQGRNVYYHDEYFLWLRLVGSDDLYELSKNKNSYLRKQIKFENRLIWVFAITGFAFSGLFLVWRIKRRLNNLEMATVAFSHGDLLERASEKNSIKLGTLNRSFNVMADKIRDLINSNKSLTNAVAHELRTPIFRIQWQAELLSDLAPTPQQSKAIARILADTDEMEDMVDELLYYARLERGGFELLKQPIDANEWLNERFSIWEKETTLDLIKVSLKVPASLYVDLKLFNRAVDNIVRNAFKFADTKIVIELWYTDNEFVIEVHDDGKGVEAEHWPFLFDPFYSANAARNKGKTGHGLGLAIVKQVCDRHQAHVTVGESYLDGACFALSFPRLEL